MVFINKFTLELRSHVTFFQRLPERLSRAFGIFPFYGTGGRVGERKRFFIHKKSVFELFGAFDFAS